VPRLFLAILITGLLIRLGIAVARDANDATALRTLPDQREYLDLGRSLISGNGLVMHDDRLGVKVHAYRAPGYPIFIAMCGGNIRAIRIAQALLDTSTILAVYLLARKYLTPAACVFASVFIAFNPYLIYFSSLILSETLFISLLAWGMYLLVRKGTWCYGAVVLALMLSVRPSAMMLPVILAAVSALEVRNRRDLIIRPLMTGATCVIVLFPWAFRNHLVVDHWLWTTSNAGVTLYDGLHPGATGASDQRFLESMHDELRPITNEVDRSNHLARKARQFAGDDSTRTMVLTLRKLARTWSPIPLSAEARSNSLTTLISAIYSVPLFALTIAGIFLRKLPAIVKVYLLVPAIYLTAIHALSVGSIRYRLPADVPMAVVAASAAKKSEVRSQRSEKTSRSDL
jgi:4-amino-4-deoxy-L-arabinose transferase-like glycosyltransferase